MSISPLLVAAVAASGVIIQMAMAQDAAAMRKLFNYYTIHTNVLVVIVMLYTAWQKGRSPAPWLGSLTVGVTIWIMVTALVYHFFLARLYHPVGAKAVGLFFAHSR